MRFVEYRKLIIALVLSGLVHMVFLGYSENIPVGSQSNVVSILSIELEVLQKDEVVSLTDRKPVEPESYSEDVVSEESSIPKKLADLANTDEVTNELNNSVKETAVTSNANEQSNDQHKPVNSAGDVNQLLQLVYQEISRHKHYPYLARRQRREGLVKLNFIMHPDGRVTDVEVIESSRFSVLDRAAQRAVEDISPFMIAADYLSYQQTFDVNVDFRLGKI